MIGIVLAGVLQAAAAGAPVVEQPDWLSRPTARDLAGVYPAAAFRRGLAGSARMQCGVRGDGSLADCRIVSESPAGEGFGAAALALAPRFRMRPRRVNGRVVAGGTVTMPINFTTAGARGAPVMVDSVPLIATPRWAEAPSRGEMTSEAPETAGSVLLRCRVTAEGRLRYCDTLRQTPERRGLAEAARRLVPRFRLAPLEGGDSLAGARVDVPFELSRTPPAYLNQPPFLEAADAQALDTALLALAVGQPDREAGARLDCRVGAAGALEDCSASRAAPEAAGPAALGLARRFRVAPWTTDGRPTAGARLRISLRYRDEQPGTAR